MPSKVLKIPTVKTLPQLLSLSCYSLKWPQIVSVNVNFVIFWSPFLVSCYAIQFLPCDVMQARRPMSSCGVCVCITFVNSVKTNKLIIKISSPLGSHTILVFPCQTAYQYSDENPPNGASNAGGVGRNRNSEPIIWLHCLLLAVQQARCCQHGRWWTTAHVPPQVVTHRW